MAVKIRLQRKGRKKRPFYHVVIADARARRDGRFIERIGSYNPMTIPATIELDRDKAYEWLMKGATPTDTVKAMLKLKGIYYRKHLMRGVTKGALSEEDAMKKYQAFIDAKEEKLTARREKNLEAKRAFYAKVSGTPPKKETPPAETEVETPTVEPIEPVAEQNDE